MSKAEDKARQKALETFPILFGERIGADKTNLQQERRNAYEKGYRQAEKDCGDISWIKETSGVKELSRAKEEALKAYPPKSIAANYDTIARRDAFEYGYIKAEKDLELTGEDLALIRLAFDATESNINHGCLKISKMTKEYYQEVLKRFNEREEQ